MGLELERGLELLFKFFEANNTHPLPMFFELLPHSDVEKTFVAL